MSETAPETPKDFDEHVKDNLDINTEMLEKRDEFMRTAAATAQQYAETTAQNKKAVSGAIKDTLLASGAVAGATLLGAGFAGATEHTAITQNEKNQQWQQEAEENLHRDDFENGLTQGKVTIETPTPETPEETTIPSPEQSSNTDIQLPTLESPKTR